MTEDRYHELVLAKLDTLSEELKDLRQECHTTFARQSDLAHVTAATTRIEVRLEAIEKSYALLQGARSVEVGAMKWLLGIVAAVAAVLVAAWLVAR